MMRGNDEEELLAYLEDLEEREEDEEEVTLNELAQNQTIYDISCCRQFATVNEQNIKIKHQNNFLTQIISEN